MADFFPVFTKLALSGQCPTYKCYVCGVSVPLKPFLINTCLCFYPGGIERLVVQSVFPSLGPPSLNLSLATISLREDTSLPLDLLQLAELAETREAASRLSLFQTCEWTGGRGDWTQIPWQTSLGKPYEEKSASVWNFSKQP